MDQNLIGKFKYVVKRVTDLVFDLGQSYSWCPIVPWHEGNYHLQQFVSFVPTLEVQLSIKILYYQNRDSHHKDKTVVRPSYLNNGNSSAGRTAPTGYGKYQILNKILFCKHAIY